MSLYSSIGRGFKERGPVRTTTSKLTNLDVSYELLPCEWRIYFGLLMRFFPGTMSQAKAMRKRIPAAIPSVPAAPSWMSKARAMKPPVKIAVMNMSL